jgi:hypothetical protein
LFVSDFCCFCSSRSPIFFSFYCGRGIYLEILSIKADSFRSSGHGWTRLALKNNALGTRISIGGFLFVLVSSSSSVFFFIEVGVDGAPIVLEDGDYLLCFGSSVLVVPGLSESSRLSSGLL